jgi:hypothetical protein
LDIPAIQDGRPDASEFSWRFSGAGGDAEMTATILRRLARDNPGDASHGLSLKAEVGAIERFK